jgi:hypothetical protein
MNVRKATPEQQAKAEARRAQFKALAEQIAALSADQRLSMAARMAGAVTVEGRSLSVHNACLLACQRPDATVVGGFGQWIKAGRGVRKGEHGLMIWAPTGRTLKADATTAETGEQTSKRPSFVMVTVFDVAQTDALTERAAA